MTAFEKLNQATLGPRAAMAWCNHPAFKFTAWRGAWHAYKGRA